MGQGSFFQEGDRAAPDGGAEGLARRLGEPEADRGRNGGADEGDLGLRNGGADEGDLGLRIGRDGTWYYRGSPIRRPALVRLFASVLRRDEASGEHWLVTPVERGRIAVEDAPFVAIELQTAGAGRDRRLDLRTNLDEWVEVGPDHPLLERGAAAGATAVPYVALERGLEARLARPVYYELAELAEPGPDAGERSFGVWSRGRFFPLGEPDE